MHGAESAAVETCILHVSSLRTAKYVIEIVSVHLFQLTQGVYLFSQSPGVRFINCLVSEIRHFRCFSAIRLDSVYSKLLLPLPLSALIVSVP